MSLCVLAGGKVVMLAASAFTLAWTHSVEKTAWEEDWQVTASSLQLTQARIKGSGAGMEPPDGAVLFQGWWAWQPTMPPQPRLVLAASGATGNGWSLCTQTQCLSLGGLFLGETSGAMAEDPIIVEPCKNRNIL